MTRIVKPTIGSTYRRMDSRITDPDQFANMRDMQVMAQNYNVVLAERIRQPILTLSMHAASNDGTGVSVDGFKPVEANRGVGARLGGWLIDIPPFVKALGLDIEASANTLLAAVILYPVITGTQDRTRPRSDTKITLSGTTATKYSSSVPVPESAAGGPADFAVFIESQMFGADKGVSDVNVVGIGPDWVMGDAQTSGGDVVYFTSNASIEPRRIIREDPVRADTATYYKVWVDEPWSTMPVPDSDTYNTRDISKAVITSLCLYPDRITDFHGTVTYT